MKTKILLVDESLTVQKVVSLTLDKSTYHLTFAKSRTEAMKQVVDNPPNLILVSDQMPDINVASFPKELESWLGGLREVAPVILITGNDIREQRHYAAVLRKPFTPHALQDLIERFANREMADSRFSQPGASVFNNDASQADEFEDTRLQKIFNETFADESSLVRQTFQNDVAEGVSQSFTAEARSERVLQQNPRMDSTGGFGITPAQVVSNDVSGGQNLWAAPPPQSKTIASNQEQAVSALWGEETKTSKVSATGGHLSEHQIEDKLKASDDLSDRVEKVLERIVPPIVERLVQQRLDELMKEQERYLELKP